SLSIAAAPPQICTLSLHDALPILPETVVRARGLRAVSAGGSLDCFLGNGGAAGMVLSDSAKGRSLMIEVPNSTRSLGLSSTSVMRSPLTKDPLVDPLSRKYTFPSLTEKVACAREIISSTRTMSHSLDRPTTYSRPSSRVNSPPWYLPEMNLSTQGGFSTFTSNLNLTS